MITTGCFTRLVYGNKTVGTSAVLLAVGTTTLEGRNAILIANNSNSIIYFGDSNVTTTTGFPLLPKDRIMLSTGADVYAVASSEENDIRIMEII